MKNTPALSSQTPINLNNRNNALVSEIERRSGVNINLCWHCNSCASGCPFSQAMDYPPNSVIRLAQLGLKKEALESAGIWICVGCNTCAIQCPNAIDITAVNDTLRQMALEEGAAIAEPDILAFHREVLNSIKRYGRTHKLEIMLRYKLKKKDWFADTMVGIKMLAKHKLELWPSKSSAAKDIKRMIKQKSLVKPYAKK